VNLGAVPCTSKVRQSEYAPDLIINNSPASNLIKTETSVSIPDLGIRTGLGVDPPGD
jgi:hypothetical protein